MHRILLSCRLILLWIPGHVGIAGNEKVDKAAKAALNLPQTEMKLPYSDFKPLITNFIKSNWQNSWSQITSKLSEVQPTVGTCGRSRASRREEVVLSRLRIGHTYITHGYLLRRDDPPFCHACNQPFTVRHFLIECSDFKQTRDQYFDVPSLKDLFNSVSVSKIFNFLRTISLYDKI